jgi:hypothetical protein
MNAKHSTNFSTITRVDSQIINEIFKSMHQIVTGKYILLVLILQVFELLIELEKQSFN